DEARRCCCPAGRRTTRCRRPASTTSWYDGLDDHAASNAPIQANRIVVQGPGGISESIHGDGAALPLPHDLIRLEWVAILDQQFRLAGGDGLEAIVRRHGRAFDLSMAKGGQ